MIFGLIHEDISIVLKLGCFNLTTAISAVSILPAENVNKGNHLLMQRLLFFMPESLYS